MRSGAAVVVVVVSTVIAAHAARADDPPCAPAGATLFGAAATDHDATLCFTVAATGPRRCLRADLAGGPWRIAPSDALTEPSGGPGAAEPEPAGAAAFADLAVPADVALDRASIAYNADRSLVAVVDAGTIELFDGKTHEHIKRISSKGSKHWDVDDRFYAPSFVGDTLVVFIHSEIYSFTGRLYAGRTGAKLGDIGGGAELSTVSAALGGDLRAFASADGDKLFVENVKTGAHRPAIALRAGRRATPYQGTGDGVPLLYVTPDGKTLVAASMDVASGIVEVDLATHAQTRRAVPACK